MSGYLLDTNIVSAYIKGDRQVERRLVEVECTIPAPVVGELYHWVFYPITNSERLNRLRSFLAVFPVLETDRATGEQYGLISARLQAQGQRIPINDMWIAALALQYDLIVATRDSDFDRIPRLRVEKW